MSESLPKVGGALLVMYPWGALYFPLCTIIGWRLISMAVCTVGLLGLPVLSLLLDMPPAVTWGILATKTVDSYTRWA